MSTNIDSGHQKDQMINKMREFDPLKLFQFYSN